MCGYGPENFESDRNKFDVKSKTGPFNLVDIKPPNTNDVGFINSINTFTKIEFRNKMEKNIICDLSSSNNGSAKSMNTKGAASSTTKKQIKIN